MLCGDDDRVIFLDVFHCSMLSSNVRTLIIYVLFLHNIRQDIWSYFCWSSSLWWTPWTQFHSICCNLNFRLFKCSYSISMFEFHVTCFYIYFRSVRPSKDLILRKLSCKGNSFFSLHFHLLIFSQGWYRIKFFWWTKRYWVLPSIDHQGSWTLINDVLLCVFFLLQVNSPTW